VYLCVFCGYCVDVHILSIILSLVYGSVTNNNCLWFGWFNLLKPYFTVTLNHNQLQYPTVNLQPSPSSLTAEDSRHSSSRSITDFLVKVKVTLRLTVSQSVIPSAEPHLGLMTRYLLLFNSYSLVFVGRTLWRGDGSVFCICCWQCCHKHFKHRG
jgi:hypothetical protein